MAVRACRHDLTVTSYLMGVSALLHILAFLATHWSTRLAAAVSASTTTRLHDADKVLVVPEKFNGSMEIVKLERRVLVRACSKRRGAPSG